MRKDRKEKYLPPTPDDCKEMTLGRKPKQTPNSLLNDKLLSIPFEDRGGTWQPRYYQENAITKVLEAVADSRRILTLATGTGKLPLPFR